MDEQNTNGTVLYIIFFTVASGVDEPKGVVVQNVFYGRDIICFGICFYEAI